MASKWDDSRTSRDGFNKAAEDKRIDEVAEPQKTKAAEGPGLDRGPTPPGGHAPRNTPWDAQKDKRSNDIASPQKVRGAPDLKRDFDKSRK